MTTASLAFLQRRTRLTLSTRQRTDNAASNGIRKMRADRKQKAAALKPLTAPQQVDNNDIEHATKSSPVFSAPGTEEHTIQPSCSRREEED